MRIRMAGTGFEERDDLMINLKLGPVFASLHSDPRFGDLVGRVGIPQRISTQRILLNLGLASRFETTHGDRLSPGKILSGANAFSPPNQAIRMVVLLPWVGNRCRSGFLYFARMMLDAFVDVSARCRTYDHADAGAPTGRYAEFVVTSSHWIHTTCVSFGRARSILELYVLGDYPYECDCAATKRSCGVPRSGDHCGLLAHGDESRRP